MKSFNFKKLFLCIGVFVTLLSFLFVFESCEKKEEPKKDDDPEAQYTPPPLKVYTDENSKTAIKQVKHDGTIIFDSKAGKKDIPEEGTIIASGVTAEAPYGFLYRVESVNKVGEEYVVKTSPAFINEVVENVDINMPIPFGESSIYSMIDAEGNAIDFDAHTTRAADVDMDIAKMELNFTPKLPGVLDVASKLVFTGEIGLKGNLVCNIKRFTVKEFGIELQPHISLKAEAKIKLLNIEEEIPPFFLTTFRLTPITILIYGVPLVISPRIDLYMAIDVNGEISFSWTLFNLDFWIKGGLFYTQEKDESGKNWRMVSDYSKSPLKLNPFEAMKKPALKIASEMKFTLYPAYNVSFYDLNDNANLKLGFGVFLKMSADMDLGASGLNRLEENSDLGTIRMLGGLEFAPSCQLEFPIPWTKKKVGGEFKGSFTLFETDLVNPIPILHTFQNIKTRFNEQNIFNDEFVFIDVDIKEPFLWLMPIYGYGLCWSDIEPSKVRKNDFRFIPIYEIDKFTNVLVKTEPNEKLSGSIDRFELKIPSKDLLPNKTYHLYSYVKTLLGTQYYLGTKFETKDVPENLSLEEDNIAIAVGETKEIKITSGSGDYAVVSSAVNIASCKVLGNKIEVKALKEGKATLTLTDKKSKQTAKLEVKVTKQIALTLSQTSLPLTVGQTASVNITSGSGDYGVVSSPTGIVSSNLVGNKIELKALKEGTTVLTVTDKKSNQTAKLEMTVAKQTALSLSQTSVALTVGQTTSVNITSGSGDYSVVSSPTGIVSSNLVGNKIELKALKEGVTTLTLTDKKSKQIAKLEVKVLQNSTPTLDIEWVDIPAGAFTMGSPEDEHGRWEDEGPQHQVALSAFKMSKYPITFAQYDAFCEATGRTKPGDEGWGRGKRPVINVNWRDAVAFADWQGGGARLPTEAEWEYACRAGISFPHCFGFRWMIGEYAWYSGNSDGRTHPVGEKRPNNWGLYDMQGNVLEWCRDLYGAYSEDAKNNPQGSASGNTRVMRGSSWSDGSGLSRSANRYFYYPDYSYDNYGFRLVKVSKDHPIQP